MEIVGMHCHCRRRTLRVASVNVCLLLRRRTWAVWERDGELLSVANWVVIVLPEQGKDNVFDDETPLLAACCAALV